MTLARTFGRTFLSLGFLAGLAACTVGCSSDEEEKVDDSPPNGVEIARGALGVGRGEKGAEADVAKQITDEIERQFPGRLAQIEGELKSLDAARIVNGKKLLDESFAAAAGEEEYPAATVDGTVDADPEPEATEGDLAPLGGSLVEGQASLTCQPVRDAQGRAIRVGRGANGRFGDDRSGASGAARDALDLGSPPVAVLVQMLRDVDAGRLNPPRESRLGAYAATKGYPSGTVGHAVHNAIGTIFATLGVYGQERIGVVFNSSQARALYNQRVDSCASYQMAYIEHLYWQACAEEDSLSAGGQLGNAFNPRSRDLLQRNIFR